MLWGLLALSEWCLWWVDGGTVCCGHWAHLVAGSHDRAWENGKSAPMTQHCLTFQPAGSLLKQPYYIKQTHIVVHTTLITALISHLCLLRSEGAVTVWSSVGFEQTKAVVGTLRTISKPFQHAQVRDVERSREQIAHLTHKLGENHLRWHTKIYTGIWHFIQNSGDE